MTSVGIVTSFVAAGVVLLSLLLVSALVVYRQITTWKERRRQKKAKVMQLQQIFKERSFDERDWSLYTVDTADIDKFRKQIQNKRGISAPATGEEPVFSGDISV